MPSYLSVFKERIFSNFKAFGSSVRVMLQARKKLTRPKSEFFLLAMLLPLLSVILVSNPIIAFIWLILMIVYIPILEAYAYAVVNGGV